MRLLLFINSSAPKYLFISVLFYDLSILLSIHLFYLFQEIKINFKCILIIIFDGL